MIMHYINLHFHLHISGQRQGWKTPGEHGVSESMECDTFSPTVL